MPRYVILRHEMPPHAHRSAHWDLMLETGGVLATWALAEWPESGEEIPAERLADHRIDYLDFEGSVSDNRGTVTRWDTGQYRVESQTQAAWHITVRGGRLDGQILLQAVAEKPRRWTVRFSSKQTA
jgi:hypothetical protein